MKSQMYSSWSDDDEHTSCSDQTIIDNYIEVMDMSCSYSLPI